MFLKNLSTIVVEKLQDHVNALIVSPMFWITPFIVTVCVLVVIGRRIREMTLVSMLARHRIDVGYFFLQQASLSHLLGYLFSGGTLYLIFKALTDVLEGFAASRTIYVDSIFYAAAYFVVLDFLGYWAHRLSHSSAILWCFHSVHHSAPRFNCFAAFRSHPVDGAFSRIAVAVPLSIFSWAENMTLTAATVMYLSAVKALNVLQHGNAALPGLLDRLFIVPQAHRIHHSIDIAHYDSNFGGVFCIWDKMFGTYVDWRTVPSAPSLPVGLREFNPVSFSDSLLRPIKHCWRNHIRRQP